MFVGFTWCREAGEDWTRNDLKMADNNVAGSHRQSYCMR